MMHKFKNKLTGKRMEIDDEKDKHLFYSLSANDDWQEMIYT